jgi:hypothetical protein
VGRGAGIEQLPRCPCGVGRLSEQKMPKLRHEGNCSDRICARKKAAALSKVAALRYGRS